MKKTKIAGDLIYSISAIAVMNIVLQFIVYPMINRILGENGFGDMLFWVGIVSVLAPSFGLAVNNTRLVYPKRDETRNGDYNITLLLFSIAAFLVMAIIAVIQNENIGSILFLCYIVLFSDFRNYSTVEYRLSLDYKRQLLFYAILSIGYIAGGILCWGLKQWHYVYIIGETLAVAFVIFRGSIYKGPFMRSEHFSEISRRCVVLAMAYLLTNFMLNLDRFVLKFIVGNSAVSQYYVLSLVGKTIAIIGGPLSSVIIGYISKDNYKLNRKQFQKIVLLMLAAGGIFWVGASIATPIFIHIFYPTLNADSLVLNLVINAAQILYFLTNLLLVIVLTLCSEKWQFIIQLMYSVIFAVLSIILTSLNGVLGFSIAALIANSFYVIFTIVLGLKKSR